MVESQNDLLILELRKLKHIETNLINLIASKEKNIKNLFYTNDCLISQLEIQTKELKLKSKELEQLKKSKKNILISNFISKNECILNENLILKRLIVMVSFKFGFDSELLFEVLQVVLEENDFVWESFCEVIIEMIKNKKLMEEIKE